MIIQVRTSRDLLDTLRIGLSPAWSVSKASLRTRGTTQVHVVNWDGTVRIEGDYSEESSIENHPDHPPGRTILGFRNGRIVLCDVQFEHRNPVSYHELAYSQETRAEPSYAPIAGKRPAPSRDEARALNDDAE